MKIRLIRAVIQIVFFVLVLSVFRNWIDNNAVKNAINGTSLLGAVSLISWIEWGRSIGVALGILAITLLIGRVYCSFYCPFGFLQDLVWRFARALKLKQTAFEGRVSARLRPFFLFLGFGLIVLHYPVYQYLDHYSLFGKLVAFTPVGIVFGLVLLMISIKVPRWFCTSVCPAGTIYGSLHSVARLRISKPTRGSGACGACTVCQKKCPSVAICEDGRIDSARCIQCFECLPACPRKGIKLNFAFWHKKASKPQDRDRLSMIKSGAAAVAGLVLIKPIGAKARELLLPVFGKTILPPGTGSWELFHNRCVGCGICVASCPSKVIVFKNGYLRMDYSKSFCGYDCNACLSVCPNGAISNFPLITKKRIKIGEAELSKERCIVYSKRQNCGACAEHCPTGAILTKNIEKNLLAPVMTHSRCIGCGACQQICPVEPKRAVVVRPVSVQSFASEPGTHIESVERRKSAEEGKANIDFPF